MVFLTFVWCLWLHLLCRKAANEPTDQTYENVIFHAHKEIPFFILTNTEIWTNDVSARAKKKLTMTEILSSKAIIFRNA